MLGNYNYGSSFVNNFDERLLRWFTRILVGNTPRNPKQRQIHYSKVNVHIGTVSNCQYHIDICLK